MSDQITHSQINDAALRQAGIEPVSGSSALGNGIAPENYPWFSSETAAPGSITLPDNVTPAGRDQIDSMVERILSHIIAR